VGAPRSRTPSTPPTPSPPHVQPVWPAEPRASAPSGSRRQGFAQVALCGLPRPQPLPRPPLALQPPRRAAAASRTSGMHACVAWCASTGGGVRAVCICPCRLNFQQGGFYVAIRAHLSGASLPPLLLPPPLMTRAGCRTVEKQSLGAPVALHFATANTRVLEFGMLRMRVSGHQTCSGLMARLARPDTTGHLGRYCACQMMTSLARRAEPLTPSLSPLFLPRLPDCAPRRHHASQADARY